MEIGSSSSHPATFVEPDSTMLGIISALLPSKREGAIDKSTFEKILTILQEFMFEGDLDALNSLTKETTQITTFTSFLIVNVTCDCGEVNGWKRENFCSEHLGSDQILPFDNKYAPSVERCLAALFTIGRNKLLTGITDKPTESFFVLSIWLAMEQDVQPKNRFSKLLVGMASQRSTS
ncbi:hypothetical protein ACFE04_021212 [Oxalis oulophora]